MELCLGTVQLGLKYGITGNEQPSISQSIHMLEYAFEKGIRCLDTAIAYGTAEEVVGTFIKGNPQYINEVKLITKLPLSIFKDNPVDKWSDLVKASIEQSLKRLGVNQLGACMLHSPDLITDPRVIECLYAVKEFGYAKRVGASVYTPGQAFELVKLSNMETIQIPYNIFDQRLNQTDFFAHVKERPIEIYARSAFLQGLILMEANKIPDYISGAKEIVSTFHSLCKQQNLSRMDVAINFVKKNKQIDYLVFGVDNLGQLKEFIEHYSIDIPENKIACIAQQFYNIDERIVMPNLWK